MQPQGMDGTGTGMGDSSAKGRSAAEAVSVRRRYKSPLRKAQAAETRKRILDAGRALAKEAGEWDWRDLTVKAVAERAGVSERTIYRHFETERGFHDALMRRLEDDAGVRYEGIGIGDVTEMAERVFATWPVFAPPVPDIRDPTFAESDVRRRAGIVEAVEDGFPDIPEDERRRIAAALDVLWIPTSYERLVSRWGFSHNEATDVVRWSLDVLIDAVRQGARPGRANALGAEAGDGNSRNKRTKTKGSKS